MQVEFVKDYVEEGNYKGIRYKGSLQGNKITGKYSFLYKKMFLSLQVSEDFEMVLKVPKGDGDG
jgi:hypothetical protein